MFSFLDPVSPGQQVALQVSICVCTSRDVSRRCRVHNVEQVLFSPQEPFDLPAMAFVPGPALPCGRTCGSPAVCNVRMSGDAELPKISRRAALSAIATAVTASIVAPLVSQAEVEYAGIGYLGGSDKIDINNANVRAYTKLPGFYPTLAGMIATNGPYKSPDELLKLPGLTEAMKASLEKYKDNLIALDPVPEYVIDKLNNGLYR